jgi:hypothetical protein
MLGLGILVRLGRHFLAGPVAGSGLLPFGFYRHLVLEALEEDDFSGALSHLKWADDPILAQLLIFRLRLLAARHEQQRQALRDLLQSAPPAERREKYQALLQQEDRALELLAGYEARAMKILERRQGI